MGCTFTHPADQLGISIPRAPVAPGVTPQKPQGAKPLKAPLVAIATKGIDPSKSCRAFADGNCPHSDDKCSRQHCPLTSEEQVEKAAAQEKKKAGGASHTRNPSPPGGGPCAKLSSAGACAYGLDCRYVHSGLESAHKAHKDAKRAAALAKAAATPKAACF